MMRIKNETLTRQNLDLQLTVEKVTKENKQLKEKIANSPGLNLKLFLFGLAAGVILSVIIYFILRKFLLMISK